MSDNRNRSDKGENKGKGSKKGESRGRQSDSTKKGWDKIDKKGLGSGDRPKK